MSQWTAKYTDEQRGSIEEAYVERRIRPLTRIVRLAAAGQLTHEGQPVPAFEIPYQSASYIAKSAQRRREGLRHSQLAKLPPRDANEQLRQRFIALVDTELQQLEKQAVRPKHKPLDAEHIRRLIRCQREAVALPGPTDHRVPVRPGNTAPDGTRQAESHDSLSTSILKALTPTAAPAPQPPGHTKQHTQQHAATPAYGS